MVKKEE